ncbi:MAG: Ig domain-containing protein [Betaproteobacteria bacterium]
MRPVTPQCSPCAPVAQLAALSAHDRLSTSRPTACLMSNRLSLICFVVAASVPAAARGGSSSPSPSSPPGPLPPAPAPVSAALEPGSATTIGTGQRISLFFVQRGGGAPYPSYVDRALVTWASSDPSRATVDANGNVAGVGFLYFPC